MLTLVFLCKTIANGTLMNFFISSQKLKIPEHGDILPGFHRIFHEIDDKLRENKIFPADTVTEYDLDKLDREPFSNHAVFTIFHIAMKHLDENFGNLWTPE